MRIAQNCGLTPLASIMPLRLRLFRVRVMDSVALFNLDASLHALVVYNNDHGRERKTMRDICPTKERATGWHRKEDASFLHHNRQVSPGQIAKPARLPPLSPRKAVVSMRG